jgi:WD repeat-containing protein 61
VASTHAIFSTFQFRLHFAFNLQSGVALGAVSVAVDSTGSVGAVCALDSSINLWKMQDFSPVGTGVKASPSEAWGIAFFPRAAETDPLRLAIAGGSSNTIRVLDPLEGKDLLSTAMPSDDEKRRERFALSIAVSPDGTKIAAGAMDGSVAIFDATTGAILHRLEGHFKPVRSVTFTPDGKHVLTACDDMRVGLFDAAGGALVESFSRHSSWVLNVACHPDGSAFATASSDGTVLLWDMSSRTCAQVLSEHDDQVWSVAWRADGARLASVSDDRSICIYDFA